MGLGGRRGPALSTSDDDHVTPGGSREAADVIRVTGHDGLPLGRDQHHRGVDRVGHLRLPEQRAAAATEFVVDGHDFHGAQEPGQRRLGAASVASDLGDDHRVGLEIIAFLVSREQARDRLAIVAHDGDQRTGIEDHATRLLGVG